VNPGLCEKMEVSRVPPGKPSRTTSAGTRTTGRNQSRRHGWAFGGLASPNKAPTPPKLKHETL